MADPMETRGPLVIHLSREEGQAMFREIDRTTERLRKETR